MFYKFRQKKFWAALLLYFVILLVLNFIVALLFREQGENIFSPESISDRIGSTVVMSILFMLLFKPAASQADDDEVEVLTQRGLKYYAGYFLFLALIIMILGGGLLLLVYLGFVLFTNEPVNGRDYFLKTLVVLVVMALLFTLFAFFWDRLRLKKK